MSPFVLIPGLNATARVYREAIEALWPHGSVTIANTLAGEGMAGIAAAILRGAPPRFALGGFSMGGYLAFEMLRQAPDRVTKLALIDTSARPDTAEASEVRRRRIEQAKAGKFGMVVEQSFPASVHPRRVENEALKAMHREMSLGNGAEAYVRHQEAIIGRPDSRPTLAAIGVPTVVIVGEADQIVPLEVAQEMHEGVAGSRLVVVPDAGHLALLEQPEAVATALASWAMR
ncbi:MAG: alpha/beta fold hydrolase [Devosia sp.]